jgi:hypothetical protein
MSVLQEQDAPAQSARRAVSSHAYMKDADERGPCQAKKGVVRPPPPAGAGPGGERLRIVCSPRRHVLTALAPLDDSWCLWRLKERRLSALCATSSSLLLSLWLASSPLRARPQLARRDTPPAARLRELCSSAASCQCLQPARCQPFITRTRPPRGAATQFGAACSPATARAGIADARDALRPLPRPGSAL